MSSSDRFPTIPSMPNLPPPSLPPPPAPEALPPPPQVYSELESAIDMNLMSGCNLNMESCLTQNNDIVNYTDNDMNDNQLQLHSFKEQQNFNAVIVDHNDTSFYPGQVKNLLSDQDDDTNDQCYTLRSNSPKTNLNFGHDSTDNNNMTNLKLSSETVSPRPRRFSPRRNPNISANMNNLNSPNPRLLSPGQLSNQMSNVTSASVNSHPSNEKNNGGGSSSFIPINEDTSNGRVVAYVQNIPNRYSAIIVANILFGNELLRNDKEFLEAIEEVVRNGGRYGLNESEDDINDSDVSDKEDFDDDDNKSSSILNHNGPKINIKGGNYSANQRSNPIIDPWDSTARESEDDGHGNIRLKDDSNSNLNLNSDNKLNHNSIDFDFGPSKGKIFDKHEMDNELYEYRQKMWDNRLRELATKLPYERPPQTQQQGGDGSAVNTGNSSGGHGPTNTSEYYNPNSKHYVDGLIKCPWSLYIQRNPIPTDLLGRSLDPFVRRVLSFFTLARSKDGNRNLGFGFAAFRSRRLLNRFHELMESKKVAPWSAKKLKIGLARQPDLPALHEHFIKSNSSASNNNGTGNTSSTNGGNNTNFSGPPDYGSVLWLNKSLKELATTVEPVSRRFWGVCSGPEFQKYPHAFAGISGNSYSSSKGGGKNSNYKGSKDNHNSYLQQQAMMDPNNPWSFVYNPHINIAISTEWCTSDNMVNINQQIVINQQQFQQSTVNSNSTNVKLSLSHINSHSQLSLSNSHHSNSAAGHTMHGLNSPLSNFNQMLNGPLHNNNSHTGSVHSLSQGNLNHGTSNFHGGINNYNNSYYNNGSPTNGTNNMGTSQYNYQGYNNSNFYNQSQSSLSLSLSERNSVLPNRKTRSVMQQQQNQLNGNTTLPPGLTQSASHAQQQQVNQHAQNVLSSVNQCNSTNSNSAVNRSKSLLTASNLPGPIGGYYGNNSCTSLPHTPQALSECNNSVNGGALTPSTHATASSNLNALGNTTTSGSTSKRCSYPDFKQNLNNNSTLLGGQTQNNSTLTGLPQHTMNVINNIHIFTINDKAKKIAVDIMKCLQDNQIQVNNNAVLTCSDDHEGNHIDIVLGLTELLLSEGLNHNTNSMNAMNFNPSTISDYEHLDYSMITSVITQLQSQRMALMMARSTNLGTGAANSINTSNKMSNVGISNGVAAKGRKSQFGRGSRFE